jgi:hypothetical protein
MTKNGSLYDLAPDLVKEWHPSANGILTPTKATNAYAEKVWWICCESHEWRATIKCRLDGNRCPRCRKDKHMEGLQEEKNSSDSPNSPFHDFDAPPGSSTEFLQPYGIKYDVGYDFRKTRRYPMKATAVLKSWMTCHLVYADVKNSSAGGIRFETDSSIEPGTTITIKLDRPLYLSDQTRFYSIIRWCKMLDEDNESFSAHGVGAEFI